MRDSHRLRVLTLQSLFEQHQERLPPALMADTFLAYEDLPWVAFSVQAQLKRMADLLVAVVLLLLTAPFVLLAALLIGSKTVTQCFMPRSEVVGWEGPLLFINYAQ